MANMISSHFAKKKFFFDMTLLHAHADYICIVCAKYQRASVKALVQVDFLMYALSKHKHNPYLIGKKWLSSQSYHFVKNKYWLSSQRYHFVKNLYFGIKLLHTNVQYVYIVLEEYQTVSAKAVVQIDLPAYALSVHKQNALRITYKGQ